MITHQAIQEEKLTEEALAFDDLQRVLLRHFRFRPQVRPSIPVARIGRIDRRIRRQVRCRDTCSSFPNCLTI